MRVFQGAMALLLGWAWMPISPNLATAKPKPVTTPVAAIALNASQISESNIRQILSQILAAAQSKNADGVVKFIAPEAQIRITMRTMGNTETVSLGRNQYHEYLKQGFQLSQDYNGTYTIQRVSIAPDGKTATVDYTQTEELKIENQPIVITSASQSTLTFKLIKGQILATLLVSDADITIKPVDFAPTTPQPTAPKPAPAQPTSPPTTPQPTP